MKNYGTASLSHITDRFYSFGTIRQIKLNSMSRIFIDRDKRNLKRNIPGVEQISNSAKVFRSAIGAHILNSNEGVSSNRVVLTEDIVEKICEDKRSVSFSVVREYGI